MSPAKTDQIRALEAAMHHDPAGRGLASYRRQGQWLDDGQLEQAAASLGKARAVGIVTGFSMRVEGAVTAETDGPPGALFLARALAGLGVEVTLITDRYALRLVQAGRELWQLGRVELLEMPLEAEVESRRRNGDIYDRATNAWCEDFFSRRSGARLTHLIAIERPGPSHTLSSLGLQLRAGESPEAQFSAEVPAADRDVCHNMRGQSVNEWTSKTHRLFEWIAENKRPITTIGLLDGGNEIGAGSISWELLCQAIARGPAARVACRIPTDLLLIAGVSNWAAYALAFAVGLLNDQLGLMSAWTTAAERELVAKLVEAGAVDGATLKREATVDGLSLEDYLAVLVAMREVVGLEE